MARKVLNAYDAVKTGQGAALKAEIPIMRTFEHSLHAIRDLDTDLLDDWGPKDRLEEGVTAVTPEDESSFATLKTTILEQGQQVPILVRPSKLSPGRYEIIFGRRRVKACSELNIPVRANVQEMDDETALMAKGLENAARRGLSFYEKALFASEILSLGKTTTRVGEVLGVSRNAVSQLNRVATVIPRKVGVSIGSAPSSGRPKWFKLADAFETGKINEEKAMEHLANMDALDSDQRLDQLIKNVKDLAKNSKSPDQRSPLNDVTIKTGRGVTLQVKQGPFATWLDKNIDEIIQKAHDDFAATNNDDDPNNN
jgi:ParB family chromosome partitioning protein